MSIRKRYEWYNIRPGLASMFIIVMLIALVMSGYYWWISTSPVQTWTAAGFAVMFLLAIARLALSAMQIDVLIQVKCTKPASPLEI